MKPYLIVGGGLAGLLAASTLKRHQIDFIGLEKSDALGGRALTGHHRLYAESSVEYLNENLGALEWDKIESPAKERHKGTWRELSVSYSPNEQFYLGAPFFTPKTDFGSLMRALAEPVQPYFRMHQTVVEIFPKTKKVVCQEENEFEYEKLIWASPLDYLATAWKGDKKGLAKLFKSKKEPENGGVNFDLELDISQDKFNDIFPEKNTIAFSFRFKDHVLRALGVPEVGDQTRRVHWMLFLPKKIFENREEVAKCVRALKREIYKEFQELKENSGQERIVFLPSISGEEASLVESVEILPNVYYLGAQVSTSKSHTSLQNMDRLVANCRQFEGLLSEASPG